VGALRERAWKWKPTYLADGETLVLVGNAVVTAYHIENVVTTDRTVIRHGGHGHGRLFQRAPPKYRILGEEIRLQF
jgi:hypothetical protein